MRISFYSLFLAAGILGCSQQAETVPRSLNKQSTVKEKIFLKSFATGQQATKELKAAQERPFQWSYFGKPRIVEYETLKDGTVAAIKFRLDDSWEGYKLKEELEGKFKTQGSPNFRFSCESQETTIEFTDKQFRVTDENCFAQDERQTLILYRRWPKYDEALIKQLELELELPQFTRVSEFLCKRKLRVIAEGPDPQTRY